ncbi:MAG TPA: S8 family serine peptidase [Gemmatimonadales bacterium]|nr:S8 family serine peptidase [Gemmatimonadales bacterium]
MPRVSAVALLVLSVAVATCGRDASGPTIPVPAAIASFAGNAQTGTVGTPLPQPLVALVTAADGTPVPGAAVSWQVVAGGGSVSASSVTTDSLGRASVVVTLGTSAGADTVQASVGRVSRPAVFAATATPAAPARIAIASGNAQTGTVGEPLHDSLVVVIRDAYGNPSSGAGIAWTVSAGSGALSAAATTSDAAGRAAVSWTLGTAAGTNKDSAIASVPGLAGSPVTFVAVAHAGPASALERANGDAQTGTVGAALAESLAVIARDQYGNPVSGAPVTWNASTGGTLSAATAPTDAAGRSSVSWTLGATAGAQQATATLPGAAGSPLSFGATANPGAPAALTFATQPGATAAGTVISPAVRVAVVDAFGNAVPSAAGPIALTLGANPGGAALAGTTQATPANGIATFSDLHIEKTGTGFVLMANGAGLPSAASAPFEITPVGSPRLFFSVAPTSVTAGEAITPAVEVTARDSLGNTFTTFTGDVTLAIGDNRGGGALTGGVTVAAVGGVATFPGLTIDKSGSGYSLVATAAGAATGASAGFDVTAGAASQLAFIVQPSSPFQGSAITPAVQVSARDAFGNTATAFGGSVTIAIGANPSSGALTGTTTTAAVAGVATFSDLRIDSAGTGYTLEASAGGLPSSTSASFQVVQVNQFTRLSFTVQPTDVAAGAAIAPAVAVTALDQVGNPASGYSGAVTISLGSNAVGGALSGTTTALAVSGVATFDELRIEKRGAGYRLRAVAAGLAPDTSDPFTVHAGPPARITVQAGNGQTAPAGTALPIPYLVDVRDAFDNPVTGATVSWSVTGGGGAVNPAQSSTDSTGHASGIRTLGLHAGTHTAAAAVAGLADSVASFSATASPNGTISGTITTTSGFLAPPAPVSAPLAAPQPAYTSDELIVTYRASALGAPPLGSAGLASPATAAGLGVAIRGRLTALPGAADFFVRGVSPALLAARVQLRDSLQRDAIAAALRRNPAIESVERNGIVRLEARRSAAAATVTLPGDPLYPRQAWHYGLIDLPRAWAITTGSAAVLVAVVDNGIRYDHPAVAGNLTHDGYDFVSSASYKLCSGGGTIDNAGDGDGYDADPTQPADYDINFSRNCAIGLTPSGNHGLHVAGTIGAVGDDGVGVTGVNWTVHIRPVRVLGVAGFGTFYDIAQGILYAAGVPADDGNGGTVTAPSAARIVNLSLGGPSGSTTLHNAVIAATNAGALVIAAAGNDGTTSLLYPAAYPEALSVSAVGPDGLLASYSSFGSTVDLAAPGGDIADGDASYGVLSSAWNFVTGTPIYDSWNGTSMATPHVSGVAALLLAQDPSLTLAQLRARLTTYAVDAGAPGPDNQYGAGIVNARNSLTQTLAPPRALYARLYVANGLLLATTAAAADGSYAFTGLGDASYTVYAGTDENGDGQVGLPGRLWGALGGSATPAAVAVDGAANYPATFAIALPTEVEPNDSPAQANALALGSYANGVIGLQSDVDVFHIRIPQSGTYTFETSAVNGACGFALEANTVLTLRDSTGTVVATNDDIAAASLNYCSRISVALQPEAYSATVSGRSLGRYRLAARTGS